MTDFATSTQIALSLQDTLLVFTISMFMIAFLVFMLVVLWPRPNKS